MSTCPCVCIAVYAYAPVHFLFLPEEAMEYLLETIGTAKYEPEQTSDRKALRLAAKSNRSGDDLDNSNSSVEEEEVQLSTTEHDRSSCCLR